MSTSNAVQNLIAEAMATAEAGALRKIVTELVREHLNEYDCRRVLEASVTPIVQEAVKGLMTDPAVRDALLARVRTEMLTMAGSARISMERR